MSKILIIGCGGVASVAIQKCAQCAETFTEICIASRTKSKCDALKEKLEGKTKIFVAHRLSTIRQCDRIIVLDGGKIAEEGTYDELIARKGVFAGLVERQRLGAG